MRSETLQQIDRNDAETVNEIAREMGLTALETVKFKLILKNLPQEENSLDVCILYNFI